MKKTIFWVTAILITISAALFQRMTGPTYPLKGEVTIGDSKIKYKLARSYVTPKDYKIRIEAHNKDVMGLLAFRRHKTSDPWTKLQMTREGNFLTTSLPHQPPAGKLDYKVILLYQDEKTSLSGKHPIIIRYKGAVPLSLLIPHALIMFLAMLFSTRAGIEALDSKSNPRKYALWAAGLLFLGGMILGPLVQKFAFGALWTGFPFGFDLTDNKTLIAMVGWTAAVIAGRGGKPARWWVLGASILLFTIYLIPHSLLGSELDYSQMNPPSFP